MITEYREYLNPKKVYIPLTDFEYKIANVSVEEGEKVLVGQKLADKFKGKEKRRVVSSVSGKVIGFEEKCDRFGKIVDHIVIENDNLNERVEVKTFDEEVTSMQIRNRLIEFGIDRVAFDGLYTNIDFTSKVDHVVVSAVYVNEPFVSTDYEFVEKHGEAIAEGLKLLGKAAGKASLTVLVDRFMPQAALDELGKAIVDKNINLVTIDAMKHKDWDYKFIQKLIGKELNTNLLKDGVLFTNIHASKMVYDAVSLGQAPTTKEIALTGDGLKVNVIFNVKIGTLLPELVEDLEGYNDVNVLNVHVGSYLTGVQVPTDEFAIVENVDSIRISEYREVEEDVCIKCGDCNDVCPAGILPQNIMDAELRNVNQRIVDLDTHLCTECGLCTYVCPSKINVLEWVRRAKRRVG